jgi:hypothetical protein
MTATLEDLVLRDSDEKLLSTIDGIRMLGLLSIDSREFPETIGAANKYLAALKLIQTLRVLREKEDKENGELKKEFFKLWRMMKSLEFPAKAGSLILRICGKYSQSIKR